MQAGMADNDHKLIVNGGTSRRGGLVLTYPDVGSRVCTCLWTGAT